ncbi:hypothetical protein DPMN_125072 [Dreissena polymorpha]|uniref:Uncharacterized protein n=1 Tax=Dreissena polymorpha TaxID=45954 RepID=A0A9D4GWU0_DREPO|nr:hypothetical protein DPMN_125072 [Dreissena polymorpha]
MRIQSLRSLKRLKRLKRVKRPERYHCRTRQQLLFKKIKRQKKFRKTVKSLLGRIMMTKYGNICSCIIYSHLLMITFCRLIAGATKLGSNCDQEKDVAVYLFVKAGLGVFFWITFLVLGCSGRMKRDLDKNLFVELYLYVDSLFGFAWFIVGMVWIFGNYSSMKSTCPLFVNDWNFHFINFAMFLAVHDLIFVVAIFIYAMYKLCDEDEEVVL